MGALGHGFFFFFTPVICCKQRKRGAQTGGTPETPGWLGREVPDFSEKAWQSRSGGTEERLVCSPELKEAHPPAGCFLEPAVTWPEPCSPPSPALDSHLHSGMAATASSLQGYTNNTAI